MYYFPSNHHLFISSKASSNFEIIHSSLLCLWPEGSQVYKIRKTVSNICTNTVKFHSKKPSKLYIYSVERRTHAEVYVTRLPISVARKCKLAPVYYSTQAAATTHNRKVRVVRLSTYCPLLHRTRTDSTRTCSNTKGPVQKLSTTGKNR